MRTSLSREQKQIIQWRERLIRLPESIFLDLIRNYLGEVKTPFNKQDLLSRLETFLNRDETRQRIITLLTLGDRHLLSAITMLDDCTEERLYILVGEGRSYLDFHLHLLNLEDRLLVFRDEGSASLHLNPHLLTVLVPYLSQSLVIPSLDLDEAPAARPLWLDDACLAALFCYINQRGDLFTALGGLKKRTVEDWLKRFAGLGEQLGPPLGETPGDGGPDRPANGLESALLLVLAAFRNLGLIRSGGGVTQVVFERWLELAELEPAQRRWLVIGAALVPESVAPNPRGSDFFGQSRISQFARRLCSWLGTVRPGHAYAAAALTTLWGLHGDQDLPQAEVLQIIESLSLLGVFLPGPQGWLLNPGALAVTGDAAAAMAAAHPLVLTPSFEIKVSGVLALDEWLTLACCTELNSHVPVTGLSLTRDSVQSGFTRGISASDLIELLARHSGREVPQNVRISIEEWFRDWQSVKVIDGVVILAQGVRATQIEHLAGLEPFLLGRPAPGVFILDRQSITDWRPILSAGGIPEHALPEIPPPTDATGPGPGQAGFLPPLISLDLEGLAIPDRQDGSPAPWPEIDIAPPPQGALNRQELVGELHRLLGGLDIGPEIREELEKRINHGLILLAGQLAAGTVRVERSEAGGLDYTAKLRILEQAIKTRRDFVEITQHAEHGSAYKLLVWPLKIRQVGSELALSAQTVPNGKELTLMVSKILLVRRIRASIFC